jgi:hypothetical protein
MNLSTITYDEHLPLYFRYAYARDISYASGTYSTLSNVPRVAGRGWMYLDIFTCC